MNMNKVLMLVSAAMLVAVAAPAQAKWCWSGKCDGTGTSGPPDGSSSSGGSTGGATPVPEPEQMGLFAMGLAIVGVRMFRARAKRK